MKHLSKLSLWPVLLLGFLVSTATGQERILSFDSAIAIHADRSMTVTETIRVQAEGVDIQRGIFRDFPTRYRDRLGNNYVVGFAVQDVTRDGVAENWRTESQSNGVRVYIGNADVLIPEGEHEYRLTYTTSRQLGFFADHDELYWNVTGNGWSFVIEQASADITLPVAVASSELRATAYTGTDGATGQNYRYELRNGGAYFETTSRLSAREGLTVVLSWPKGIIAAPTDAELATQLLSDNLSLLLALITMALTLAYLFKVWTKVGRDPAPGVIFPHYEPPAGFSPAAMRYISRRNYDMKTFTAAVVNLAVKGYLRIYQDGKKFRIEKTKSRQPLSTGEAALYSNLITDSQIVTLNDANYKLFQRATNAHRRALRKENRNVYFFWNSLYLLPSLLLTFAVLILLAVSGSLVVVAGILLAINLLIHGLFLYLLQAPSETGRKAMDKFEGFKLYLNVAEKDDLRLQHPPDMTPALFERYLPYAIALGVEESWANQFTKVFQAMAAERGEAWQPIWYAGNFNAARMDNFASAVSGQLSSAISSASSPPGSASGASGGSSGGGGGGGGGGGW